jgi:phospholipid/cholesterol/gamma-HCH transport system substrate-binding protein
VSELLQQFQQIAQKINAGQGTAGQLVNDPQLYQSLVATTQELNATIADLKRLVEQWEQEGVSLKVGK